MTQLHEGKPLKNKYLNCNKNVKFFIHEKMRIYFNTCYSTSLLSNDSWVFLCKSFDLRESEILTPNVMTHLIFHRARFDYVYSIRIWQ